MGVENSKPGWSFKAGFIAGLGFGIGLVCVVVVWDWIDDFRERNQVFSEGAGLEIHEHRMVKTGSSAYVLGSVRNTGSGTWRWVNIRVELKDATGQFVDECTDRMDAVMRPGQSRNFKVVCYGSKEKPIPDFATYAIAVDDALMGGVDGGG